MTLRNWRYFLAIATAGTVAGAARKLGVAQPALSRHLALLEEEFGMALFRRHRRGVELTDAGILLRERATRILDEIDGLRDEIQARAAEPKGTLAIGMPPSISALVGVPLLQNFLRRYPAVRLTYREGPTETLLEALEKGELDATVATVGEPTRPFDTIILASDYLGLAAPPGTMLDPDGIHVADLAGRPLIFMANARFMMDRLSYAAARDGVRLDFVLQVNSMIAMRLVEAGLGCNVSPMCAVAAADAPRVTAVPILDLPIEWALCTPRTKPQSAALIAFQAVLTEELTLAVRCGRWPWGSVPGHRAPASPASRHDPTDALSENRSA